MAQEEIQELTNWIKKHPRGFFFPPHPLVFLIMQDVSFLLTFFPDAVAYNNRAILYSQINQYDSAIRDLTTAIEIDSKDADLYFNRADVYMKKASWNEAINDLTQAISLNPNFEKAYAQRGVCFARLNKHTEAAADYEMAKQVSSAATAH
jgi:tetratricopeptide (TPR) repeat protein